MNMDDDFDKHFGEVSKMVGKAQKGIGFAVVVQGIITIGVIGLVIWGLIAGIGYISDKGLKNIANDVWEGKNAVVSTNVVSTNNVTEE